MTTKTISSSGVVSLGTGSYPAVKGKGEFADGTLDIIIDDATMDGSYTTDFESFFNIATPVEVKVKMSDPSGTPAVVIKLW